MYSLHFSPKKFSDALLDWFASVMRPLPWRESYEAYAVWISEVMLQQTQAERGARYFEKWMRLFPDVPSLAAASEEAVLAAWEGLGYYSRARNLHRAARLIMEKYEGRFPEKFQLIRALPGVGDYTAGAVASIAFNRLEPAVDANVLRVLARVLDTAEDLSAKGAKERVRETARALIPVGGARLFNQALMELGALACVKKPKCEHCPAAVFCLARTRGTTGERPLKKAKTSCERLETVAILLLWQGGVYVRRRPPKGLWAGLWEFPGGRVEGGETPEEAAARWARELTGEALGGGRKIGATQHGYTRFSVLLHGYRFDLNESCNASEGRWIKPEELACLAFPAGQRKLLEALGWKKP